MTTTKKVVLLILVGILYFIFDTMLQAGVFKSISSKNSGNEIEMYRGVWGTEDLDWDRENNLLFISSSNRWEILEGLNPKTDGIYILKTDDENAQPVKIITDFKGDFHPHGISLFKVDSVSYLYIINHDGDAHSVELFEFKGDFLHHLYGYTDEKMFHPNDVVGDEVGKFYVTNDHGNRTPFWRKVEDYLRMPYAYLLYYNGSEYKKVHKGMVYANGVNLSNDGTKLYVSHTTGHEVFVLDRNKKTGSLILKETLTIPTGIDNIDVDENDMIWVAGHPKLFDFLGHEEDSTKYSPSQFFKIDPKKDYEVTKMYENSGAEISGSSVVVVKNDTAYAGCVFQDRILKMKFDN